MMFANVQVYMNENDKKKIYKPYENDSEKSFKIRLLTIQDFNGRIALKNRIQNQIRNTITINQ